MRAIDYVGMASRNLVRQKSRTILTIVAITIGSLSLILMSSLIISVRDSLIDQFKSFGAFNLVTVVKDPNAANGSDSLLSANGDNSEGKKIDDATVAAIRKIPHVVAAAGTATNVGLNTMRLEGNDKKTWSNITAYDPSINVFDLPIAYGRNLNPNDMDKIIIGSQFAEEIGYTGSMKDLVGKKVVLNYRGGPGGPDWGALPPKPNPNPNSNGQQQNNAGIDITAEIVGVAGNNAVDSGQSYITLAWAKRLMTSVYWQMEGNPTQGMTWSLNKEDMFKMSGYSSVVIKVDNTENINAVADEVKKLGYGANTAQKMLDQINQIMKMVGIGLGVVGGISLFVAAIGIINTMVMATYERTREIGVMRACGATRAVVRRLFTIEAGLLGFWGGVFGLLISLGLVKFAGYITHSHAADFGNLPIESIGNFPWWLVAIVIIFTTVLGMFSGLFPAIRAARMNPVDALRYE